MLVHSHIQALLTNRYTSIIKNGKMLLLVLLLVVTRATKKKKLMPSRIRNFERIREYVLNLDSGKLTVR